MWWKVNCTQPPPFCSADVTYPSMVATVVPRLGSGGVLVAYGSSGGIVSADTVRSFTPATPRPLLSPQYCTTCVSTVELMSPNGYANDSGWNPCAARFTRSWQTWKRASASLSFLMSTWLTVWL